MLRSLFRCTRLTIAIAAILPVVAFAAEQGGASGGHVSYAMTFLWIAILLVAAKVASLVEKAGQPSVLGELIMGLALGNVILLGIPWFEYPKHDSIILFLSELGVVILLFQIGLESDIKKMMKVGVRALMVAIIGVVLPFVLGTYMVGPWLLPGESFITYLFLGAALTATSVGITARVFRDLGKLQSPEAQIVLGAAVIDDVIGLIILAVVSAIATTGSVTTIDVVLISGKSIGFLLGAIIFGQMAAPLLGRMLSLIHTGVGMKFTLAISFGLVFAAAAQFIGLAPIVGAFAAGLVLDPVHFRYFKDHKIVNHVRSVIAGAPENIRHQVGEAMEEHAERHIDELIEPLGHFFVPIFFVMTGMSVKLETMFDTSVLLVALGITVAAFIGKIASGLAAGPVRKSLVGWGMVPRGEVGLIFASIGRGLGAVSDQVFSVIVIVVILTTLCTPPILTFLLRKSAA
jgi:Kef-type K+ transport system membrane component KefB